MKIKNITNSRRLVWDKRGKIHEVGPYKTIELDRPKFDKRSFQIRREVETGAEKPKIIKRRIKNGK